MHNQSALIFGRPQRSSPRRRANWTWLLALMVAIPATVSAQTTIGTEADAAAPDPYEAAIPAEPPASPSVILPSLSAPVPKKPTPLTWGPIRVYPGATYRFLHGNNLLQQPGRTTSSSLHEILPSLSLALGERWTLDYLANKKFYSDPTFEDSLDHRVSMTGTLFVQDWLFGVAQRYISTSDPLIETGRQTDQETYATGLTASHPINEQMGVELSLNQNIQNAQGLSSSREWSAMALLDYKWTRRFSTSIGFGGGFADITGPDMLHEEIRLRTRWAPGQGKLVAEVNVGAELRQFLDSGISDQPSPLYGASLKYKPVSGTSLSLNADRSIRTSLLANQITENTTMSFGLRQRFLRKFYFDLTTGYRMTDYRGTVPIFAVVPSGPGLVIVRSDYAVVRNDDTFFLTTRLSADVLKKGRVALFYQLNDNTSSTSGFEFNSHQVGFEIGYRF